MVDQDFGRQNNPINRPTLDSTALGTNTTNGTTSPIDSIPVGTKTPGPMLLALPTDLPGYPNPDPSLSDSSKKYNSLNDTNSKISKKKKCDKKKRHQKDKKDDLLDPSLIDDFDSSYNSDNRRKQRKRESDREKYTIKSCARLTEKLLTTAYK